MTHTRKDGPTVILGRLWDEPVTVEFLDGDVEHAPPTPPKTRPLPEMPVALPITKKSRPKVSR